MTTPRKYWCSTHSRFSVFAVGFWAALISLLTTAPAAAEFMAGADISSLKVLEDHGGTYRDNGVAGNAIDILHDHGMNWFRLRLFVNPNSAADPFVANDLNYTIALAQRAKAVGAKLLLDFHYSDTWADPGHQTKPAAWSSLNLTDLVQRVHDYTRDATNAFAQAGVAPDMVQVGNEIANGMLWNSGYVWTKPSDSTGFNNLASLLNAGIAGAKEGAPANAQPLIMIHHDKGASWTTTSYFFDKLVARNVNFDVIGYSYYPKYQYTPSTGAGGMADLQTNLNNTANAYHKPVVIVETGFASRGAQFEPDFEFDVSPTGQQQFTSALVSALQNVPDGLGQGLFWWYPEARPTSGLTIWQDGRYGLFDQNGDLLPAASVFDQFLPPAIPGDFNIDGVVDTADYVFWRNGLGTSYTPADYDTWRAHFGQSNAGGISAPGRSAVPEPAAIVLLIMAATILIESGRRSPQHLVAPRRTRTTNDAASSSMIPKSSPMCSVTAKAPPNRPASP